MKSIALSRWVRFLVCMFQILVAGSVTVPGGLSAATTMPGDVAPYGSPDGKLDAADLEVMMKFLEGAAVPTADERQRCDVAPEDKPDGELDPGDLLVLERAVMGLVTLDPGAQPMPPLIWGAAGPVDRSPYLVSGLTEPGAAVNVYLDAVYQGNTIANGNGLFSLDIPLVAGMSQVITATSVNDAAESDPSVPLVVSLLSKPAPADLDKIVISGSSRKISVNGKADSVAAGATVIIKLVDGTQYSAVADSVGGFELTLDRAGTVASISVDTASGILSEPAVVTTQGSVAGMFKVDASGAATYSIPVSVPPGTAGMSPGLSLDYSSNGGNGPLGRGWSLGGLSTITRCPQTIAQDGTVYGVNLDMRDRYCLDGKRLIASNGGVDGADGTEYRTEVESFTRVVSHTGSGVSPDYFEAWTRSGLYLRYGYNPDSAFNPGGGRALVWAVDRVADRAGNYYTVTYHEDTVAGEHYPVRIDYTANDAAALLPYNSIRLSYQARTDPVSGYVGTRNPGSTQRLGVIRIYSGDSVIRDYRLTYDTGPVTGLSRLVKVRECAYSGAGRECRMPTRFVWENGSQGYADAVNSGSTNSGYANAHVMDVNGDGRQDLVVPHDGYWWINYGSPSGLSAQQNTSIPTGSSHVDKALDIDYNGDGLSDLLVPGDDGYWDLLQAAGGGFNLVSNLIPSDGYDLNPQVIDYNGDGLDDLVYIADYVVPTPVGPLPDGYTTQTYPAYFVYLNTTSGFGQALPTALTADSDGKAYRIDFNHDRRADLMATECSSICAVVGHYSWGRDGAVYPGTQYLTELLGVEINIAAQGLLVQDVNGDGFQDALIPVDGTWEVSFSTGTDDSAGAYTAHFTPPRDTGLSSNNWQYARPVDYNNDGRMDVLFPDAGAWWVYQSTGEGFDAIDTGVANIGFDATFLMDVNGDGMQDIVSAYNGVWNVRLHAGQVPDQVTGIINGTGLATTISYGPLTDAAVYTKGTSADPLQAERDFQVPLYVATQTGIDDGTGGRRLTDYSYAGAILNLQGRGLLGFREIRAVDRDSGIVTRTTYRQDFPYVGLPEEVEITLDGLPLSETVSTYSEVAASDGATGVHFPYLSQSVELGYDLPDNGSQGALLRSVNTVTSYDDYGNPLTIDVTTTDAWGNTFRKLTTNTYDPPDLTAWVLDRLTRAEVTHEASNVPAPDHSITKVSEFSYYPAGDPHQFLLQDEITEPDAGEDSPLYQKTTHEYDAFGNAIRVTTTGRGGYAAGSSPESRSTETVYDSQGRFPLQTTNARVQSETYTYDSRFGTKTSLTGPNGLTTSWAYDSFGRKVLEQRADGTETTWRYDFCASTDCPHGGFVETVEASGSAPVTNYYDALQRVIRTATLSMSGQTIDQDTAYDTRGNVASKTRPYFVNGPVSAAQVTTNFQYDVLDRPVREDAPDGGVVEYTYSNLTRNTHRWDPNGDYDQYDTRITDGMDQLTSVVDALNGSQSYQYDAAGDLIRTTDAAGNSVQTGYDLRGRKTAMDDPDMGHWEYQYNAFGELVWQRDAKGQVVTMAYDRLGRMVSRSEPEGATTWNYDTAAHGVGRLASVSYAADGYRRTLAYDPLGRLASESSAIDGMNLTMAYGYDGFSRPQTVTYPSGFIVRNVYDGNGFLTEVRDAANDTSYWHADEDDAEGRITMETLGNGLQTIRTYDATTDSLATISTGVGSNATVQNLSYTFDGLGNLKTRTDARQGLSETFAYDALNRLQTAAITGMGSRSYAYDALGNITGKSDYADHYSYNTNGAGPHAVTEVKDGATVLTSYSYDANGNMTGGDGRHIDWTSFNKAAQITKGTASISFAYDADHNRVKQVHGATTTYYLHPSIHEGVNYEEETTGTLTGYRHYIHAGGRAVAIYTQRSDGTQQTRYLHTDHLGSIDAITEETGAVVERMSFAAFGSRRNADWSDPVSVLAGFETHHGFTGQEQLDDVGLIHMNGRLYDPQLGRFLSPDPQIQYPDQTQSFNRYTYVNNNPVSLTDPSGYGFFSSLWKSIKNIFKNPKALFAIAAGFITGFATWAALGYGGGFVWGGTAMIAGISAAAGSFVTTLIVTNGDLSAALKAGFISGLTAFVGVQVKQGIKDYLAAKGTLYNVEKSKDELTLIPANAKSVRDRLFVNGILNDLDRAVHRGLQQVNTQSFSLYYNSSHGFIADLTESALGKLFGNSSLSRGLADILRKNPNLVVIAHSQGGIIATNAIQHLSGMDLSNLRLTLNGSAVAERVARAALEGVGSSHLVYNSYPFDLVPNVVALDTVNPVRILGSIIFSPFLFTADSPHAAYY